jgi:hypothetical protein
MEKKIERPKMVPYADTPVHSYQDNIVVYASLA